MVSTRSVRGPLPISPPLATLVSFRVWRVVHTIVNTEGIFLSIEMLPTRQRRITSQLLTRKSSAINYRKYLVDNEYSHITRCNIIIVVTTSAKT